MEEAVSVEGAVSVEEEAKGCPEGTDTGLSPTALGSASPARPQHIIDSPSTVSASATGPAPSLHLPLAQHRLCICHWPSTVSASATGPAPSLHLPLAQL